jgi:hypothetical protein
VIVPGLTEVRPGAAIPVVMSFLLGPAAAWGSGFGNVIADALGGMLGPGSLFGFIGNFLYGYVPYALWRAFMGRKNPVRSGVKGWLTMLLILVTNAIVIGSFIGWGADVMRLAPFAALGPIIAINNFIASGSIATILLALLYSRVEALGLLYYQVLDDETPAPAGEFEPGPRSGTADDYEPAPGPRKRPVAFALLLIAGAVLAFGSGVIVSGEVLGAGYGAAALAGKQAGTLTVALRMAPGLLMVLLASALL